METSSMPTTDGAVTVEEAFARAQELHRAGKLADACIIYVRILEAVPEHVNALHFLGVAQFQRGLADSAIELIEQALRIDPEYADAHNNLGNVHKRRGDLARARTHYERALSLSPENH